MCYEGGESVKPMSHYGGCDRCEDCPKYRKCYFHNLAFHVVMGFACGLIGALVTIKLG